MKKDETLRKSEVKGRHRGFSAGDKSEPENKGYYSRQKTRKSFKVGRNVSQSLVGKCLVSIGNSENELYNQAVIYITSCKKDVVEGIMINKLLFGTASIECKGRDDPNDHVLRNVYEDLYQGGPENPAHGYVLFPTENGVFDDPFAEVQGEIAVSTSFGVLQDILDGTGPKRKIIAMGHCVWHRGQLEWEIFNNRWLIIPSDIKLMFDTDFHERWEKAKIASGFDIKQITQVGLA